MALHLKLKPHSRRYPIPSLRLRLLSSATSSPPPPPPPPSEESPPEPQSQPSSSSYQHLGSPPFPPSDSPNPTNSQPSFSSYFSDVRQRLGSPSSPPRRIPTDPAPPPSLFPPKSQTPNVSFDEIRKHLAGFRRGGSAPTASPHSSSPPISFQELFKKDLQNNPPGSAPANSFDAIRQNLRQSRDRDASISVKSLHESIRGQAPQTGAPHAPFLIGSDAPLPESIFGREAIERKGEEGEGESEGLKTEFLKSYTYQELGEKLLTLRPREEEEKKKKKKKEEGFSLAELNQRLLKLREMEEKEAESRDGHFSVISETLRKIQDEEDRKKATKKKQMSTLRSLGGLATAATPTFMLYPPKEQLLEKYFHPDHMSSAEKMKLQLQKVRDEYKLSESDCGSARVQVAQLTTKIKHLSTVLHKKDKHSIKGLQEMVQRRKKLLKYLRRTDWDSYCLVLSRFGLRDVPEYKPPDYTKTQTKSKTKSKSKSKKKIKA